MQILTPQWVFENFHLTAPLAIGRFLIETNGSSNKLLILAWVDWFRFTWSFVFDTIFFELQALVGFEVKLSGFTWSFVLVRIF
jgi:hypothetical protein